MTHRTQPHQSALAGASFALVMMAVAGACPIAAGQVSAGDSPWRDDGAPPSSPPAATDEQPAAARPAELLREGTRLVEAEGEVVRDAGNQRLVFLTQTATHLADSHPSELILLPSTRLEQIDALMQQVGAGRMRFAITGSVYLYQNRNYLLPSQAIQLGDPNETPPPRDEPAATAQAQPAPDDDTAEARRRETDEIIRELEQSLGPVASPNRELLGPSRAAGGTMDAGVREGTIIVQRRCRPMRTADGRWRLVFDADASGFSDPPMIILPCRLLEQLQRLGQRDAASVAVRITGEVYIYNGQPHLMPLSFHEASDRARLAG